MNGGDGADGGQTTRPGGSWWSRPATPRPASPGARTPSRPTPAAVPGAEADAIPGPAVRPEPAADDAIPAPAVRPEPAADDAIPGPPVRPEPAADAIPAPAMSGAPAEAPLHEPDPYDTPPYGDPGPWAPAPQVRHPAAPAGSWQDAPAAYGPFADAPPHGTAAPGPGLAPCPPGGRPAADPWSAAAQGGAAWQRLDPWAAPGDDPYGADGYTDAHAAYPERSRRRGGLVAALVFALVTGVVGGGVGAYLAQRGALGPTTLPQEARSEAGRAPDSVAGIAASTLPGVVTLHVRGADEAGTGTGFVLDRRGHILTNNHVVALAGGGGEISVTFSSGRTARAKVVGKDGGYDLAVVQVTGVSGLAPLPLGNSDNVRVGDPVVAIGAPFDLSNTVTSGIISAKDRPITAGGDDGTGSDVSYVDALQTDAPINPGNSGGPLVDAHARVIGINSAIRAAGSGTTDDGGQAGSIGLGFAIPVNQAKRVAEELIDTGRATHPVIGVTLDTGYPGDGARVAAKAADGGPAVTAGGPADRAGIRAGDVITAVDGDPVHSGEELIVRIRAHRPGDRLTLTVRRGGTGRTAALTLGSAGGT
ncbi:trypsin-like peptidase domain-containing protein [Streptomyces sp. NPDC047002]|uniref:trypsin-like peptidase domain-containing protein n=1 Tax=Streptomyces sp. NPDC047002 TaxID=3155475 RepID=UPI00345647C8